MRYFYGIRIRFEQTGRFDYFSSDKAMAMLTSILVFVGFAKQIVHVFASNFLGLVSKVYKGYFLEEVDIQAESCAMALRLCSYTTTFKELQDTDDGISQPRLLKRFMRALGTSKDLDETE